MIGEIGGTAEERAAEFIIKANHDQTGGRVHRGDGAAGKRMGHAGAIISGGKGEAEDKIEAMKVGRHRRRRQPGLARHHVVQSVGPLEQGRA